VSPGPATALVLSGGPGYSDQWHPFERTSEAVAALLEDAGHRVEISTAVAGRLADLSGVDLLVVNAPLPEAPLSDSVLAGAREGLGAFLGDGGAVLAIHVGVTALAGISDWSAIVGARWIPEHSGHPPLGQAALTRLDDPRTGPGGTFELYDERYTDLRLGNDLAVVVEHEHEGRTHPLVWTREAGPSRVIADTLGHGPESFQSPEHRELVTRLVAWAVSPRTARAAED
jgi:type 1 glutamine amidotransferase